MKTIKNIILVTLILSLNLTLSAQDKNKKVTTAEFKVNGVCNMCKDRIENAAIIKGVKFAEWNKQTDSLKVIYRTDKVTIDEIHKSIAKVGHSTDKEEANMDAYNKLPACCAYMDDAKKH